MDFELNEDQIAFADMARAFAQNELEPNAAEWDQEAIFPIEVLQKAGELGFCSLYTPRWVAWALAGWMPVSFSNSWPWGAPPPPLTSRSITW